VTPSARKHRRDEVAGSWRLEQIRRLRNPSSNQEIIDVLGVVGKVVRLSRLARTVSTGAAMPVPSYWSVRRRGRLLLGRIGQVFERKLVLVLERHTAEVGSGPSRCLRFGRGSGAALPTSTLVPASSTASPLMSASSCASASIGAATRMFTPIHGSRNPTRTSPMIPPSRRVVQGLRRALSDRPRSAIGTELEAAFDDVVERNSHALAGPFGFSAAHKFPASLLTPSAWCLNHRGRPTRRAHRLGRPITRKPRDYTSPEAPSERTSPLAAHSRYWVPRGVRPCSSGAGVLSTHPRMSFLLSIAFLAYPWHCRRCAHCPVFRFFSPPQFGRDPVAVAPARRLFGMASDESHSGRADRRRRSRRCD
jgi:hypothetical protein